MTEPTKEHIGTNPYHSPIDYMTAYNELLASTGQLLEKLKPIMEETNNYMKNDETVPVHIITNFLKVFGIYGMPIIASMTDKVKAYDAGLLDKCTSAIVDRLTTLETGCTTEHEENEYAVLKAISSDFLELKSTVDAEQQNQNLARINAMAEYLYARVDTARTTSEVLRDTIFDEALSNLHT